MQNTQVTNPAALSFAELLERYSAPVQPKRGTLVQGTVTRIDKIGAWIDFHGKSDAIVPADEANAAGLQPNQTATFLVLDEGEDSDVLTFSVKRAAGWIKMQSHQSANEVVRVKVNKVVHNQRGGIAGLQVTADDMHGFMPYTLIGMHGKSIENLVDKELDARITEVSPETRRLVFDHSSIRRERAEAAKTAEAGREQRFAELTLGSTVTGKVVKTAPYGVFVDIGNGLNGLLRTAEMLPGSKLNIGDEVLTQVIRAERDEEGKRLVGLSSKRPVQDPFLDSLSRNATFTGTVREVVPFGLFVRISDEHMVDGLVHISEFTREMRDGTKTVKAGDSITVRVLSVDREASRVKLTVR